MSKTLDTNSHNGERGGGSPRSRLVEATIRTIEEHGREGTTAREIARVAEANLGSIAYYFGSKDALVDQALVVASERWTDHVREAAFASGSGSTLGDRLAGSLGAFLGSLASSRPLALTFLEALASADRSPTVRSALAELYDELRGRVTEETGGADEPLDLGAGAASTAAAGLVALFDGLVIQGLLDPDRELDAVDLVGSLGALLGTALAETGNWRAHGESLAQFRQVTGEVGDGGQGDGEEPARCRARVARARSRASAGRRRARLRRGEVYRLRPRRGAREAARPSYVVLLQADKRGDLPTALVAPTSRRAAPTPSRPEIELQGSWRRVLVDHLRAVDRERLVARVGRLSAHERREVDDAMAALLGLE